MADLYYYKIDAQWSEDDYQRAISLLPLKERKKVSRFIRWQDRHASIVGKLILRYILLKKNRIKKLEDIVYNTNGKPLLLDDIHFNISHSGNYVVCCITEDGEVGVDIEEIRTTKIEDFKSVFTTEEWQYIETAPSPTSIFYELWTKKEATIKADGKGLSIPLSKIKVLSDCVQCDNKYWFVEPLELDENYKCHVATSSKQEINTIRISEMHLMLPSE